MEIDLVGESLKFMALGMMVVFVFLVLLVQVIKLQAKVVDKFFSKEETIVTNTSTEAHHVAAIVAAISEFRKR